jgi:hypothetical protein
LGLLHDTRKYPFVGLFMYAGIVFTFLLPEYKYKVHSKGIPREVSGAVCLPRGSRRTGQKLVVDAETNLEQFERES